MDNNTYPNGPEPTGRQLDAMLLAFDIVVDEVLARLSTFSAGDLADPWAPDTHRIIRYHVVDAGGQAVATVATGVGLDHTPGGWNTVDSIVETVVDRLAA